MVTVKKATKSVEELVEKYESDPKIAVILAATFVHWRLKTVLRMYLKHKDKKVSLADDRSDFVGDLKVAYGLDLISRDEFSRLCDLAKNRNQIAHRSKAWRKPNREADRKYLRLSTHAVCFMKTLGSEKLIRRRFE